MSSEVGAGHRIQTDTIPLHSYSQSLDRGDEQFFPHRVRSVDPVHLMDSGVGSSDSVGSEYERGELTCSITRVGGNQRGSPPIPDEEVSVWCVCVRARVCGWCVRVCICPPSHLYISQFVCLSVCVLSTSILFHSNSFNFSVSVGSYSSCSFE